MHADRRAGEIEPVGGAGGDVVLLVSEHDLELAQALHLVGMGADMALKIGGVVHAGKHAHGRGGLARHMACALHAFPAQLEEHALLRVHQFGFERADAEEGGIEIGHALQHAARGDVGRIGAQRGGNGGVEFVGAEKADALAAFVEHVPEGLHRRRVGEASGHADDGDGLVAQGFVLRFTAVGGGETVGRDADLSADVCGDAARRRIAEKRGHAEFAVSTLAQRGQGAQDQQGIAAEGEEIVRRANAIQTQHLGEDRGNFLGHPG